MKTTPEALKALYQTLGGSSGNVAGESKTTGILNKIAALFGSTATADKIPDAIDNINAVASGVTKPDGKITITENATDINVAQYATADVNVSGGGGSSDFSTATVTFMADDIDFAGCQCLAMFMYGENNSFVSEEVFNVQEGVGFTIPLYQGEGGIIVSVFLDSNGQPLTVDSSNFTLTQNISLVNDIFVVSGDGTITVKHGK